MQQSDQIVDENLGQFVDDNLDQFLYKPNSSRGLTSKKKQPEVSVVVIQKNTKKKAQKNNMNSIQEMNFKYIWNFLKQRQDSEVVTMMDIAKAVQAVMKKPIDETLLQEMININRDQEGISEEELREIFIECKLKM